MTKISKIIDELNNQQADANMDYNTVECILFYWIP